VYFFVYFHRAAVSVIVPDLLDAFDTDATALGLMSSMYFYLYALEQPLVGHLADRMGPRRVVALWSLTAAVGCAVFAAAPTVQWAAAGRALIGFGVGGVFVPGMKAFSQWFRPGDFATLTGLFLAVGNVGAIGATTPLAWVTDQWGWRSCFAGIGAVTLCLALFTLVRVRDYGQAPTGETCAGTPAARSAGGGAWRETIEILASGRFWILGSIFFGLFGAYGALQGLWATPFLMSTLGLHRMQASLLNMVLPVGFMLGAPLGGRMADRLGARKVNLLLGLLTAQCLIWTGITGTSGAVGVWGMVALLVGLGLATGGMAATFWALVRDGTPAPILGATTGLLNPAPFLGSALLQVSTGAILDAFGRSAGTYPPEAFSRAFLPCLAVTLIPTAMAWAFKGKLTPAPATPPARPRARTPGTGR
jgi:MFS family permease